MLKELVIHQEKPTYITSASILRLVRLIAKFLHR